ncbi:integrase arm-type DNA-binding domain-containing protein [Sphingomonas sp. MG17]|uniref:Integrase arm-type DNA-binding domain-containing protein n=1 Tax=Sphingomonas tagetis TaxID=2949092 RepID=A0A9X2HEA9_9SPHN|nr:integrase arm-type DNA-binding domain-containing protein [Sphingomonas tagetis]MCP3729233.1 integrase arm-type DNA-binding domain-containing protein [Sphingomonas tagetis]
MLTDMQCRNAKKRDKAYKLADERGLYLYVTTTGFRSWRFKYRMPLGDKLIEKRLIFGPYPDVPLEGARAQRDEARRMLREGLDPAVERQRRAKAAAKSASNTFELIARDWHKLRSTTLATRYAKQILDRFEADVFPPIGKRPIGEISAGDVLEVIRAIEARGSLEMAHKVRTHISDVFVHAIACGLAKDDPAHVIRKALQPTQDRLWPARTKLKDAREVLEVTEARPRTYWGTRFASRLLALTAARPGIVRLAEKSEFEDLDGKAPIWRVPAEKMKLTRERKNDATFEFVMPLSYQAVELVKLAIATSASKTLLFPSIRHLHRPISDSTLSKLYRDAGFTGLHVPHGWRASFSTIMNELAAADERETDRAIIDMMLAHVQEGVEAAYNRAAYLPRRREIAQRWADLLVEGMPPPAELLLRR